MFGVLGGEHVCESHRQSKVDGGTHPYLKPEMILVIAFI